MLSFRSSILNLHNHLNSYLMQGSWEYDRDYSQILSLEQQLQEIMVDTLRFKTSYEPQHQAWKSLLWREIQQLRAEDMKQNSLDRLKSSNQSSGVRKSLLKQQLTRKGDILKIQLDDIVCATETSLNTLQLLLNELPTFPVGEPIDIPLDRLVQMCQSERNYNTKPHSDGVTWIIGFLEATFNLEKQLDKTVVLLRRLQEKVEISNPATEEDSRYSFSGKLLDFSSGTSKRSKEISVAAKPESDSCIRCCIF